MKKIFILPGIVILLVSLAFCGGSSEPDPATYTEICQQVVQCDAAFTGLPIDPMEVCTKTLANVEKSAPEKIQEVLECLNGQTCETQSLMQCAQGALQGQFTMP
ncbi:MAG: hypothetical protein H7A21_10050 [Spirochaetales bacterium]|nr:hypothetical protein [Leptospiraceae bacterium]MCP5481765.1 hypothetical protein [Spirochaetales bacterium]